MSALKEAAKLREQGKPRDAINLLKKYVEDNPRDAAAWRLIGDCFHDLKKWKRMLAHWRKARQLGDSDPGLDTAILTHSMKLQHTKKPELIIDDEDCRKRNEEGIALINKNRFEQAVKHFEKLTAEYPQYSGPWINLGLAHYKLKHYDKSIKYYKKALEIDENPLTYFNLGTSYIKKEDWKNAAKPLEKAVELDSEDADYWFNLGFVYYYLGEYEKAVPCLKEALELSPDYANVQYRLAMCYAKLKNEAQTIKALRKVLRMNPKWKSFAAKDETFSWLHDNEEFKQLVI